MTRNRAPGNFLLALPLLYIVGILVLMAWGPVQWSPDTGPVACGKELVATAGSASSGANPAPPASPGGTPPPHDRCGNIQWFYGIAALFVVFLWVTYLLSLLGVDRVSGAWNPVKVIEGADGRASTSKFQFFLWTTVLFFSYVAIYLARWVNGHDSSIITEIPRNVMLVTGMSIFTVTTAKAITTHQVNNSQIQKPSSLPSDQTPAVPGSTSGAATTPAAQPAAPGAPAPAASIQSTTSETVKNPGLAGLFQDDSGILDLAKFQLVGWTFIAVAAYFIALADQLINYSRPALPNIDDALMALMGFGHVAYLGKKVISTDVPVISGVSPAGAQPPTSATACRVSVFGSSFGDADVGNQVTFDRQPVGVTPIAGDWTDTTVTFTLPRLNPRSGLPWKVGDKFEIGLIVAGRESANTVPFSIMPDWAKTLFPASITNVAPANVTAALEQRITVTGQGFGKQTDPAVMNAAIYVDNDPLQDVDVRVWEDDQIVFVLPKQVNGAPWKPSHQFSLGIMVQGEVIRFATPITVTGP